MTTPSAAPSSSQPGGPDYETLKATVGKALGRVPSGVYVLSVRHDGRNFAMLASWVQQASFAPPAVSVAVARDRPILDVVRGGGRFALSVLGEHDGPLMKKFARAHAPDVDPFDGVATLQTPGGVTVLAEAVAWLEGHVTQEYDFGGDHALLVATVADGAVLKPGASFTHLRGNGFHY